MHILQNNQLKIAVKNAGAELCEISSVKHNTQFMWDANPNIWAGYAPNLFPIIGGLKNGKYIYENKTYSLPKHGFIRNNENIKLHEKTDNSLTLMLSSDKNTLKNYPFKFEFYITYKLVGNTIEIIHTIKNCDDTVMYFSLGGHPALKCPIFENENYNDYTLEFNHIENSETYLVNMDNGLIKSETKPVFNNSNTIALAYHLFNRDALIFKDLKSDKVILKSKTYGDIISVTYTDFPYLGIWAQSNGHYVCIEPWLGIGDNENTNQDFKTKEGILTLNAGKTFKASYSIEVNNKHLK